MREIEFRGYNLKNKVWIYGHYFVNRGRHFIVTGDELGNPFSTPEDFEIDIASLGQYTWLKGKNGVKIYEGDYTDSGLMICFIDWMFIPYYDWGNQERYEDVWCDWWSDCQIIGNQYENPNLPEEYDRE